MAEPITTMVAGQKVRLLYNLVGYDFLDDVADAIVVSATVVDTSNGFVSLTVPAFKMRSVPFRIKLPIGAFRDQTAD